MRHFRPIKTLLCSACAMIGATFVVASAPTAAEAQWRGGGAHWGGGRPAWGGGRPGWGGGPRFAPGVRPGWGGGGWNRPGWGYRPGWNAGWRPGWNGGWYARPGWRAGWYGPGWGGGWYGGPYYGYGYGYDGWGAGAALATGAILGAGVAAAASQANQGYCFRAPRRVIINGVWRTRTVTVCRR
ncbi:hypothetical protein [Chelatococcus asaccharovorans]|uniref:hypothetical protein n=1 Tax=Chelatococcus asaccharovorans TaxID=28210 RepID=UPI00224C63D5|nr:hypothetical protein [Chelatococcus asaccharovorans]CAH1666344.1 conserved exported hypothetical protein [Chelatococcus asaccharovorans]CAH1681529.1 conserved exported hypothetical protein [Chelatococcus asaccharovorans]